MIEDEMEQFLASMERVAIIMANLEAEHIAFFTKEEHQALREHKKLFRESVKFWYESSAPEDEKKTRIANEHQKMFDALADIIDANVENWNNEIDEGES